MDRMLKNVIPMCFVDASAPYHNCCHGICGSQLLSRLTTSSDACHKKKWGCDQHWAAEYASQW